MKPIRGSFYAEPVQSTDVDSRRFRISADEGSLIWSAEESSK